MIRILVAAFLVGVAFTLGASLANGALALATTVAVASAPEEAQHRSAREDVAVVLADVVSDVMWDDLRAQGYRGDPGDGMEALYVPREVAAAACRSDLDCNLYG